VPGEVEQEIDIEEEDDGDHWVNRSLEIELMWLEERAGDREEEEEQEEKENPFQGARFRAVSGGVRG
jgi:hypothetical protein